MPRPRQGQLAGILRNGQGFSGWKFSEGSFCGMLGLNYLETWAENAKCPDEFQ
jgi:hypothetical protein